MQCEWWCSFFLSRKLYHHPLRSWACDGFIAIEQILSTFTLNDEHTNLLIESVVSEEEPFAKPSAYLIARLCEVPRYRDVILKSNVLTGLLKNLRKSPPTQISVLMAIRSLLKDSRKAANQIMGDPEGSSLLFRIAKNQTLELKLVYSLFF